MPASTAEAQATQTQSGATQTSAAQKTAAAETADDLSAASLENLTQLKINVSSFARKDQDLWKTPAAVFVITREEIERSAATSIPELLRMVPGMQVAQATASTWAVSARGFNSEGADKLLVLIDGRTVYSEIFSGAHWDEDDLPLEEIERIEVIRGPGAAVWGTNAVNGVVNIITRRARSTVGATASAQVGRIDEKTSLQYGSSVGDRIQYRGYTSLINREPLETAEGKRAYDGEDTVRAGGRLDWQRTHADWLSLSGDIYGGHVKDLASTDVLVPAGPGGTESDSLRGGHLLGRTEHKCERGDTALQVYYDDTSRTQLANQVGTRTLAADFQDHLALSPKNDLVWGAALRLTRDHGHAVVPVLVKPNYNNFLIDAFAQDEITLLPNRLVATLGSKIQDGTLAGFQVQPSARMLWSPTERQSLWGAVSRAVVAPTIQDQWLLVRLNGGYQSTPDGPLPLVATLSGNPKYKPEKVIAYEVGYRRRLVSALTIDVASFFNINERLKTISVLNPVFVLSPTPHLSLPLQAGNGYRANTAGLEAAISWKPRSSLTLQAGYTWMQARLSQSEPGIISLADTWNSPRNTVSASTSWSFAPKWSLSTFIYHVDALPEVASFGSTTGSGAPLPAFSRLDLHLSRKVSGSMELDAGGTNLLTPRHKEFLDGPVLLLPSYVPRSFFLKAKWAF